MHIAVCMDIAADRKQMERLLGRSCDRRLASGETVPVYVQSYGNKEAIFARPAMYDLFLIDMHHDTMDSVQIIDHLKELGVTSTICFCPTENESAEQVQDMENVLVLRQPVKAEELDRVLDTAIAEVCARIPRLELRTSHETLRIPEEDFLYAEKSGYSVLVHLADGRQLECAELIEVFFDRANAVFENIYFLPDSLTVSHRAIADIGFSSVTLKDGRKFHIGHKTSKAILKKITGK